MIYRCPNAQTLAFIDCLNYVVGIGIDILLRDLNIDALDEAAYRRLKDTLSSYNLKVLRHTHLDGALLGDVYLLQTFEHDKLVMSVVNNIYFPDRDAVTVELKFSKIVTMILILTFVFKYFYIVIKALWIPRKYLGSFMYFI